MIDQEEYILLMKMRDIDRYNEIKKEKINNIYSSWSEKLLIKFSISNDAMINYLLLLLI